MGRCVTSFPKPPRRGPKAPKSIARRTRVRSVSPKKRAEIRIRTDVTRPTVLARDRRCRACHKTALYGCTWWLEVHEEPPRSLGGDPTDPRDCVTLCKTYNGGCHLDVTEGRLTIEKLTPAGCNGLLRFRKDGKTWED